MWPRLFLFPLGASISTAISRNTNHIRVAPQRAHHIGQVHAIMHLDQERHVRRFLIALLLHRHVRHVGVSRRQVGGDTRQNALRIAHQHLDRHIERG